jgi:hypothetical protein
MSDSYSSFQKNCYIVTVLVNLNCPTVTVLRTKLELSQA